MLTLGVYLMWGEEAQERLELLAPHLPQQGQCWGLLGSACGAGEGSEDRCLLFLDGA